MYQVGKVYKNLISNREAIIANLKSEALTLKFLWKNPGKDIIGAFKSAPFFQIYFKNDIMFLLLKFDGLNWVDIPCYFAKNTKNYFSYEGENFPVNIILANSNTGLLFINETYLMPKGITKAFIQSVHTQKDFDKKVVLEKINSIRSSYSSSEIARLSLY